MPEANRSITTAANTAPDPVIVSLRRVDDVLRAGGMQRAAIEGDPARGGTVTGSGYRLRGVTHGLGEGLVFAGYLYIRVSLFARASLKPSYEEGAARRAEDVQELIARAERLLLSAGYEVMAQASSLIVTSPRDTF